jgi:hypothetical protein
MLKELSGNTIPYIDAELRICDDGTVNVTTIEEHKPEEVFSVGFGPSRDGYC